MTFPAGLPLNTIPLSVPHSAHLGGLGSNIGDLPDSPKYSIKAVCVETGIRPVTLRAWERRYQLLHPHRTRSNYRLYSERDVALLRWLKSRVDSGLPISTAASELQEIRRTGGWPETLPTVPKLEIKATNTPPALYVNRLYKALTTFDEPEANMLMNEVLAGYDLQTACVEVITPCMHRIGDAWQRGDIRIATEHFATNFVRGRLNALFHTLPMVRGTARIIVGCAPGEMHDIGALIFSLLLRREGYRVEFLGQDVHVGDLIDYARSERPTLICLIAGAEAGARELRRLPLGLATMRPRPKFAFAGSIFNRRHDLRDNIQGIFLGESLVDGLSTIRRVLGS